MGEIMMKGDVDEMKDPPKKEDCRFVGPWGVVITDNHSNLEQATGALSLRGNSAQHPFGSSTLSLPYRLMYLQQCSHPISRQASGGRWERIVVNAAMRTG